MSFEEIESDAKASNYKGSFNNSGVPRPSAKFQRSSLGQYFLSHQFKTLVYIQYKHHTYDLCCLPDEVFLFHIVYYLNVYVLVHNI